MLGMTDRSAPPISLLTSGQVLAWNRWHAEWGRARFDVTDVALDHANLRGIDLSNGCFNAVSFLGATLSGSDFSDCLIAGCDFTYSDLSRSDLTRARLRDGSTCSRGSGRFGHGPTSLSSAILTAAQLPDAVLDNVAMRSTTWRDAGLYGTTFFGGDMAEADFTASRWSNVRLLRADLSAATLREVIHHGPCSIDMETLRRSQGRIPSEFLRNIGCPESDVLLSKLFDPNTRDDEAIDILYAIERRRGTAAIGIAPLFISYSHGDAEFVERLERALRDREIRSWRDVHDLTAGPLDRQIDRAIRLNPTLLVVLSKLSLASDWVEWEVSLARELEKQVNRPVLCPVALDGTWKDSAWPKPLMNQLRHYNVLDFSRWADDTNFKSSFARLEEGLKQYYRASS